MEAGASDDALLAATGGLSAGLVAEGALRQFSLGLDLRRFEAGSHLPLNLASIVLELELPQELAGGCCLGDVICCAPLPSRTCPHGFQAVAAQLPHRPLHALLLLPAALIRDSNGRLPPRLAPLRTQPVAAARGSAVALQGGQASCEFSAGLMAVAALLARWVLRAAAGDNQKDTTRACLPLGAHPPCKCSGISIMIACSWLPTVGAGPVASITVTHNHSSCSCSGVVMTVDVFHREALADDLLLGRAHVPLAPLLQVAACMGCAVLCCPMQHSTSVATGC